MNSLYKIWTLVFMLLVIISTATAIGISPARKTIFFEPGLKGSFDIRIINNKFEEMKFRLYAEGDLKDIISFSSEGYNFGEESAGEDTQLIYLEEGKSFSFTEESKEVTYHYELPETLEKPGVHEIKIFAQELVESKDGDTVVGAVGAVAHQFHIIVPYPGKYLEAELRISETALGEPVTFIVPVISMGYEDINSVKGVVEIFDSDNNLVGSTETQEISLKSKDKKELVASWNGENIDPGKMKAKLTVYYDGKTTEAEKVFNFGQVMLKLVYMKVKNFKLGEIAKFDILLENQWSELVEGVFVETIFFDKFGDEVRRFKTPTENFDGGAKKELHGYMDTMNMEEGVYDLKVLIYYNNEVSEKHLRAAVTLNGIEIGFFGATAQAISVREGLKKNSLIMFLIFLVIVINIGWYIYFKRRHKANEEKVS